MLAELGFSLEGERVQTYEYAPGKEKKGDDYTVLVFRKN